MEILVRNKAIEDFLATVADAYHELYPDAHDAFLAAVRERSHALINPSGMSEGGTFLDLGCIPKHIYHFIRWQARKRLGIDDFFRDSEHYRLLFKAWPDAATKRKPTKYLKVPTLTK